ncbi:MAG: hypothetical protein II554_03470, partial [Bacteroidales bacterium]|nr:hypothetical protein [Bacteroidales bacterium]
VFVRQERLCNVKCTLVSPAPCFSQNIPLFFPFQKNCRKGTALKYGGIKNVTETPIAVGVCLILGVKFLSEGRNVSLLDGCKRYCGVKINNGIYDCSDVTWRVAT